MKGCSAISSDSPTLLPALAEGFSFPPSPAGTLFPDYVVHLLKFAEHSGMRRHGKLSVAMWPAWRGGTDRGRERGVVCLCVCVCSVGDEEV